MHNLTKGILLTILYVVCFAIVGLLLKIIGPSISAWEKVFWRGVGFFIMAVILVRQAKHRYLKHHYLKHHPATQAGKPAASIGAKHPAPASLEVPACTISYYGQRQNQFLLSLRSFFGVAAAVCNIYIVNHISLADADMLEKLYMLYMVLLSAWFLGEHATKWHYLLIGLCLPALWLIIKPSFANPNLLFYVIGLAGGLFLAISFTAVRALAIKPVGEHPSTTMVHFSTVMMLSTVVPAYLSHGSGVILFQGVPVGLNGLSMLTNYGLLLAACAFAAAGALSMTYSYKFASSKETSVYGYTGLLVNGLLGFVFFATVPDYLTVLGYLIIVACGVALFLYNHALFKQQQRLEAEAKARAGGETAEAKSEAEAKARATDAESEAEAKQVDAAVPHYFAQRNELNRIRPESTSNLN